MREEQHFPIGFWNYVPIAMQDASAVKDWSDAGMTLTMGPEFGRGDEEAMLRILDAADRAGIRVILCHADSYASALREKGEERYRTELDRAMKPFRGHPAVYGFVVGDEPGIAEFDSFCRATRIQKELAPEWVPFGNLLPWYWGMEERVGFKTWPEYLGAYVAESGSPLLCYDYYAHLRDCTWNPGHQKDGINCYFHNLREFGEASRRHGIPFWTTVAAQGDVDVRVPTEDDFRWQLNAAVAHGAQGVLYYFLYMRKPHRACRVSPIDEHGERTETFARMSRVNRTFLKWQAPVVQNLSFVRASHLNEVYGGWPAFDGSGPVSEARAEVPLIVSEFRHRDGRDFVMVVNGSQTRGARMHIRLEADMVRLSRIDWMAEEERPPRNASGENGRTVLYYDLAPGQMELYGIG